MPAGRRTPRDERRRSLGQNFLRPEAADRLVEEADVRAKDLVVEPGAGAGALTMAMAKRGADVFAIELDAHWSEQLAQRTSALSVGRVRVMRGDFLSVRLPSRPYRVLGCPPFAQTTALLAISSTIPARICGGSTWSSNGRRPESAPALHPRRCCRRGGHRGGTSGSVRGFRRRSSARCRRWTPGSSRS
ncbi:MAG: hypothetical protein M3256_01380 [Actinomycetota bacterium]|nr:hypothetical protein [Actinomycetota bacterium]